MGFERGRFQLKSVMPNQESAWFEIKLQLIEDLNNDLYATGVLEIQRHWPLVQDSMYHQNTWLTQY